MTILKIVLFSIGLVLSILFLFRKKEAAKGAGFIARLTLPIAFLLLLISNIIRYLS